MPTYSASSGLMSVLTRAQESGFIGPGPLAPQIAHATGFALGVPYPQRAADLGSGGGLPALVLALMWTRSKWVLVESMARRATFLDDALRTLQLEDRVRVAHGRAEDLGQEPAFRDWADLVTARGFGVPALAAENAAPLLRVGGRLVVSEPPGLRVDRWPALPLRATGLRPLAHWRDAGHYRILEKVAPTNDAFPRRPKVQQRQPLWGAPGKRTA